MINGEVRAPNCYLDALETLKRQYYAYLFDRVAGFTIGGEGITRKIGDVVSEASNPTASCAASSTHRPPTQSTSTPSCNCSVTPSPTKPKRCCATRRAASNSPSNKQSKSGSRPT